jgi:hypothetical protein
VLFVIAAIVLETARCKSLKYLWLGYVSPYDLKTRIGIDRTIMDRRVPLSIRRYFAMSYVIFCVSLLSAAVGLFKANQRELGLISIVMFVIFIYSAVTVYFNYRASTVSIDYERVDSGDDRDRE